jgi:DNA-binding transcriptional ArsR family regulator
MLPSMTAPLRRITDPEILKGLTHPLRRQVFRLLAQFGPATVSTLAEHTDSDPGRLSYHLRELAKRGFIEPAPELARDGRESWWRLTPGGISWSSTEMGDPAGEAVANTLFGMTVGDEFTRLQAWDDAREHWDQDWVSAAHASSSYLRLTPDELRELAGRIEALICDYRDAADGRDVPDRPAAVAPDDGRESVFLFFHGFPEKP